MMLRVLLDSGVLSSVTHTNPSPLSLACSDWFENLLRNGDEVFIPEVTDYEVRREYLRQNNQRGIVLLDQLAQVATFLPLETYHWRAAAILWSTSRQQGHITTPPNDLNIDVLLAAQAQSRITPNDSVVIATTNVRHLAPFVDARIWQDI